MKINFNIRAIGQSMRTMAMPFRSSASAVTTQSFSEGRRNFLKTVIGLGVLSAVDLSMTGCEPAPPPPVIPLLPKGYPAFPASGCLHAANLEDHIPTPADVEKYETQVGKKLAGVVWFQSSMDFKLPFADIDKLGLRVPIIKWGWDGDLSTFLTEINAGLHDNDIKKMAESVRDWGRPLLLMPFYEPNLKLPWGGPNLGADSDSDRNSIPDGPQNYKDAFNRVVMLFRQSKAENAKFAWVVNWESDPPEPWNNFENYYPDQCDYVGFDFFNGAHLPVKKPEDVLAEMVKRLQGYEKPIIIGEVGVAEGGVRKPFWIRDFFEALKKYPEIKMFVWFNHPKEADWQFDSSPASLKMAKQGLQDAHITTDFLINPTSSSPSGQPHP